MNRINREFYEIFRSRDNGNFWSNLTPDCELTYEQGVRFIDRKHKAHLSDWLRLVKIEYSPVISYGGTDNI